MSTYMIDPSQVRGLQNAGQEQQSATFIMNTVVTGSTIYVEALNGLFGNVTYGGPKNVNGIDGTDTSKVLKAACDTALAYGGGKIFFKKGTYPVKTNFATNNYVGGLLTIEGEDRDACILDFTNCAAVPYQNAMGSHVQCANWVFLVKTCNLNKLTFHNCMTPDAWAVAIGGAETGIGVNTKSYSNLLSDIVFIGSLGYGVGVFEGMGSKCERLSGDNPAEILSFWGGYESNITCRDIFMQPTLSSYPTPQGLDDTIAFNPGGFGSVTDNIFCENIVGDYSLAFQQNGDNTFAEIGAVVDFAGFGLQQWTNIHCKHIVGKYAPAINMSYAFQSIQHCVFEDIHSSYAGWGQGQNKAGMMFDLLQNTPDILLNDITCRSIFIDHAKNSGISMLGWSTQGYTAKCILSNIKIDDVYLWDCNQGGSNQMWQRVSGIDIGGAGSYNINQFASIAITNIHAWDDQATKTQYYGVSIWAYGTNGSFGKQLRVDGGVFWGQVNDPNGGIGLNGMFSLTDLTVKGIKGYATEAWGSVIGTGADQAIAHELVNTPVNAVFVGTNNLCTVSNVYADTTYVYATLTGGQLYYYHVRTTMAM